MYFRTSCQKGKIRHSTKMSKRAGGTLTGGVTSEVSAAEAQASAPQLEAGLRHALPLLAHVVISGGEGVVAGVPVGREPFGDWRVEKEKSKRKTCNFLLQFSRQGHDNYVSC